MTLIREMIRVARPEADLQAVFEGLDMDIRSVFPHRLGQKAVNQPDDRGVVLAFQEFGSDRHLLGQGL
jgi:hypothetical protein